MVDDRIERVSEELFKECLVEPVLEGVFSYWKAACGDGDVMPKEALDPTDILKLLPQIFIMDVLDGGTAFQYRLVGTFISDRLPASALGKRVEDVRKGPVVAHLNTLFGLTASSTRPCLGISKLEGESSSVYTYKRLALPMSTDGKKVDQLFGGWTTTVTGKAATQDPSNPHIVSINEAPDRIITTTTP